jgi:hypothetical protein
MDCLPLPYLHRIRKSLVNTQTFQAPPGIEEKIVAESQIARQSTTAPLFQPTTKKSAKLSLLRPNDLDPSTTHAKETPTPN